MSQLHSKLFLSPGKFVTEHKLESCLHKKCSGMEEIMIKKVSTEKAPAAIGPYSQAVIADKFLFASGQIPINPENGLVEAEGIEEQTKQVMKNIGAILVEAGCGYENVVKTTCFLADMKDFAAFNAVYEQYFKQKPARSCVAVKQLPKDVLCEVEVTACLY